MRHGLQIRASGEMFPFRIYKATRQESHRSKGTLARKCIKYPKI
jgi:hypothetical protein